MQTQVVTLGPDMTVRDAGRVLEREGISGAPVVGDRGQLLGVLSQTDLLRRHQASAAEVPAFYREGEGIAVARLEESPSEARVAEVMTPAVLAAQEETPVVELARLMLVKRIHRVVIVRNRRIRGIVSTMDLLRVMAGAGAPARRASVSPGGRTTRGRRRAASPRTSRGRRRGSGGLRGAAPRAR